MFDTLSSIAKTMAGTFDFSSYEEEKPTTRSQIEFLGLSIEATDIALRSKDGLYRALRLNAATKDLVFRGSTPTTGGKLLLIFGHNGYDTTFDELAEATGCNVRSVEAQFNKVRHWLREGFRLEVQRSGARVFLANNNDLRGQSEKLIANVKKMQRQFDTVLSCVNSIEQSGGSAILPPDASLYIEAHRQVKQLSGSNR